MNQSSIDKPTKVEACCRTCSSCISCGGGGACCFIKGTKVLTPGGERSIETLQVGDQILSFDPSEKQYVLGKVVACAEYPEKPVGHLTTEDGLNVITTPDHPFFSMDKNDFVLAENLAEREVLLVQNEGRIRESLFTSYVPMGKATVYNITVEDCHTYFANNFFVHNRDDIRAVDKMLDPYAQENEEQLSSKHVD